MLAICSASGTDGGGKAARSVASGTDGGGKAARSVAGNRSTKTAPNSSTIGRMRCAKAACCLKVFTGSKLNAGERKTASVCWPRHRSA